MAVWLQACMYVCMCMYVCAKLKLTELPPMLLAETYTEMQECRLMIE